MTILSTPSPLAGEYVPATAGTHAELIVDIYTPDVQRPPSRLVAHSGAPCEISDLREILLRGVTKLRGLIRRVPLGQGGGVYALPATCGRSPCASKFSGNPRRFLWGGWALPERNVFGGRHQQQDPGQQNYGLLHFCSVRQDPSMHRSQNAPRRQN